LILDKMGESPAIKVFPKKVALDVFAAATILELAISAANARGIFHFVLSGGGTPDSLYERLASSPIVERFPWGASHFYWGDERAVPPIEVGSNYRQAHETLLSKVPANEANIHRIKGELNPQRAAEDYANQLLEQAKPGFDWPRFDVVLLGVGADGHTASLFPGLENQEEPKQPVMPVTAHYGGRPANRISLTPVIFNSARNIIFLVTGVDKASAVAASLEGEYVPLQKPTQRIRAQNGQVFWLLDEAAAGQLSNL
jgi:6-phosphogluconolactonase